MKKAKNQQTKIKKPKKRLLENKKYQAGRYLAKILDDGSVNIRFTPGDVEFADLLPDELHEWIRGAF